MVRGIIILVIMSPCQGMVIRMDKFTERSGPKDFGSLSRWVIPRRRHARQYVNQVEARLRYEASITTCVTGTYRHEVIRSLIRTSWQKGPSLEIPDRRLRAAYLRSSSCHSFHHVTETSSCVGQGPIWVGIKDCE